MTQPMTSQQDMMPRDVAGWQHFLENINQDHIELGLERVQQVLSRLELDFSHTVIVQVAGTNGKGSSAALIAGAALAAGYKTGLYTSPHLLRFNERIQINGQDISDEALCSAFARVYQARGNTDLTYFEFTTLAAFCAYAQAGVELMVLEIGLGGRLDAVNVLDADIALIASIGMDHMAFLGHTLSAIASEKAGIIKKGCQVVCGRLESEAASVIQDKAAAMQAQLFADGKDFEVTADKDQHTEVTFRLLFDGVPAGSAEHFPYPKIPLVCTASSVMVLKLLAKKLPRIDHAAIAEALRTVCLPGRMQQVAEHPAVYLDVAHNVPAARHLCQTLQQRKISGRRILVCGMLRDKDIEGVLSLLAPCFDAFFVTTLYCPRGAEGSRLQAALVNAGAEGKKIVRTKDVASAMQQALSCASEQDEILVAGSFVTVTQALQWLHEHPLPTSALS